MKPVSLATIEPAQQRESRTVEVFIFSLVAVFVAGVALTLRRAKKQSQKGQMVKPSEIKRQRKEKILDEEDGFEIEAKFERVI